MSSKDTERVSFVLCKTIDKSLPFRLASQSTSRLTRGGFDVFILIVEVDVHENPKERDAEDVVPYKSASLPTGEGKDYLTFCHLEHVERSVGLNNSVGVDVLDDPPTNNTHQTKLEDNILPYKSGLRTPVPDDPPTDNTHLLCHPRGQRPKDL